MLVNIKKLHPDAVIPTYAKPGDAGMDLVATTVELLDKHYIEYGTGLAVEIPEGYVGLVFPRSSNSKKDLQLCNAVGVIDSSYRGEIKLRFRRIPRITEELNTEFGYSHAFVCDTYAVGDRVGQIMILPYPKILFHEVQELSSTERGTSGFGSSGK